MTQCKNQQNQINFIKQLRNKMINVEFIFQLLFNVPNKFQRAYGAIIDQHFTCIFGYFGAYTSSSLKELIIFVTKYNIFYVILVYQYHESLKFAVIGTLTSIFMIVHYYHTNNKNQPQIQEQQIKYLQVGLETMFQKHFQQQISEVNILEKCERVVGSIRINLQNTMENTVLFSRLFEQACLQYKFQIFEASSNSIIFGANTAKPKHLQLDECVQVCYIVELIAKQLNMIISAGISSGTIQFAKYMFGNNQLIMQLGDSLQKSDLFTKQSFDEILIDINQFYKYYKYDFKPNMIEPQYVFTLNEKLIQFKGQQLNGVNIQIQQQMLQQIEQYFGDTQTVREFKMENIQEVSASDLDSQTINDEYQSQPTKHSNILLKIQEVHFNNQSIHKVSNQDYSIKYQTVIHKNVMLLSVEYIRRIKFFNKTQQFNQKQKIISVLLLTSINVQKLYNFIYSQYQYIFFAYCGNIEMTYERVENQFAIQIFSKILSVKYLIRTVKTVFAIDFSFKAFTILIVFFMLHSNKTKHKLKKYYFYIDQIIEKITFGVSLLSYMINQYNLEAIFIALNEYLETQLQYNHMVIRYSIAHVTLIVMFSSINLTTMLDVTLQSPFTMSRNMKVILSLEIIHFVYFYKSNPWYAFLFLFSQLQQIPWLLYQFQISINNIGQQIKIAEYVKKQKTILSRRRNILDVECELLMLSENQPILISEIIGDQTVNYIKIDINPSKVDKQIQYLFNLVQNQDLKKYPVIQMNQSYIFKVEYSNQYSCEFAESVNHILQDINSLFDNNSHFHIAMINIKANSSKWVCYSSELINVNIILTALLSLLKKHSIGIVLSGGDLKVIPLCCNNVHCDVIGEAADEIEDQQNKRKNQTIYLVLQSGYVCQFL
ncbi:Conserved_hypothetical protein [Hexamita inflata]|uniref:Uncharacterized protein n=1 Tax=Hexamita inflata TaxID=28002 RepID=A0AA86P6A4_9EUKA|nr:Conserved hypothetical protein [Hexamita inflata]